jgi:hypothetical protein
MTRFFLILALCATAVFAADKPTATTPAAPGLTVPKDATPNPNGTFDYTDPQGKHWVYRNTPLGMVRIAVDDAQKPPAGSSPLSSTKVTDLGDSVRFEIPTPIGHRVVVKKKSEMTEEEQAQVKTRLAEEAAAAHSGSHE